MDMDISPVHGPVHVLQHNVHSTPRTLNSQEPCPSHPANGNANGNGAETGPFGSSREEALLSPRRRSSRGLMGTCPRPSLISQKAFVDETGYDGVDALPEEMSFTVLDMIALLFSIGSFLFDIGTDIVVAAFHYYNKDYWYFALTTFFIVVPTLVMTGISLRWYILDAREEGSPSTSTLQWTVRVIFLLLQLGPILRYFDALIFGLKSRKNKGNKDQQQKYFQYMVYEDTDATMLRLFECFMEAAPQLVLQIYILAKNYPHDADDFTIVVTQVVAVVASLVSLSWSLVSYHRTLRMSLYDKVNMTWPGMAVQFLWRFSLIAARVLALALFAAVYTFFISVVCGVHWLIMFGWIISMRTSFCDNRIEELGYNAVLAVMFIFCYFNPVDSPTRYRYATYYVFMFAENTLLMSMWYFKCPTDLWYRIPAMGGHFLSFFAGIFFMVIYYLLLHPTGKIRIYRNPMDDKAESLRQTQARRGGYKRQSPSGLWTTQGKVLHPRPTITVDLPPSSIPSGGDVTSVAEEEVVNNSGSDIGNDVDCQHVSKAESSLPDSTSLPLGCLKTMSPKNCKY